VKIVDRDRVVVGTVAVRHDTAALRARSRVSIIVAL